MNTYICFYKDKRVEVQANTSYEAQLKASKLLKAKKSYEVTIVLVAVDGKEITHTPNF